MTPDRVIGRNGEMPWRMPSDLGEFRAQTMREIFLIMGRPTFQAILRHNHGPLLNRHSIVLSRGGYRALAARGALLVDSEEAALEKVVALGGKRACVIGGGKVYEQFLPFTDIIYRTVVRAKIEGDAFFPELDPSVWKQREPPAPTRRIFQNDEYPSYHEVLVRAPATV